MEFALPSISAIAPDAALTLAEFSKSRYFGIATAAMMPRITRTAMSSIKVKPF
jgi:hypothetical protein